MKKIAKDVFFVALVLTNLIYNCGAIATPDLAKPSDPPPAPDTGTIEGESAPGGTRIDKNSKCKQTEKNLVSLLSVGDLTISEYPTFWFYIPYNSEEISNLEFVLKKTSEPTIIYRTSVRLFERAGIIKISIPTQEKYALALQENYNWNFSVYCATNQSDRPNIVLNGSLRRIPISTQLNAQLKTERSPVYRVYMDNYIYYDAITNLAASYLSDPNNKELINDWNKLLEVLGRKQLVGEPIVRSSVQTE
jgi:hypothetical protein